MEREERGLDEIRNDALETLEDRWHNHGGSEDPYFDGAVREIADSFVPIYNHELTALAKEDDVWQHENELPPAFDGTSTICNLVVTAIYEILTDALCRKLADLRDAKPTDEDA